MEELFPLKEGVDYSRLKITPEGNFSITKRKDAERIVGIIKQISTDSESITDVTACCGGDTINFGLHFKNVFSIEKNKENFEALKNNIEVYDLKNVQIYNEDSLAFYDWYSNILYIDPPWGGPEYKQKKNIDLYLSNKRLDVWLEEILLRNKRPDNIFLKLPSNYNFDRINKLPNRDVTNAYGIRSYILIHIKVHNNGEKRI